MNTVHHRALSSEPRHRLVELLRSSERTTGDLASHFEMSRVAIGKHLLVLEEAGLVASEKRGRQRFWRLVTEALPIEGGEELAFRFADTPDERLWRALTSELRPWWPAADLDAESVDLRLEGVPGGRLYEVFATGGGLLRGIVEVVRPGSLLVLRVPLAHCSGRVTLRVDGGVHLTAQPATLREAWRERLDGPLRAWLERGEAPGFGG